MSGPPWSGQPPQRKPVTLKNWFVQPMKGGVAVEGYKAESDEVKTTLVNWRSTVIVKRISPQLVQTGSGSLYRLYKELDDEAAKENGIPEELISPFLRGFPDDWEQRVKAFYEPTSVRPAVPRQLVNDVQQREKENHPPAKQNLTNKSPAPPPVSRGSSSKELNDMAANLNTPTTAIVRRSTRLSALRTPLSVNGTTKVDIYERIAAAQTPLTTKKNELRLREEKKRLEEEEKMKVEERRMEEEEEKKMAEENERKKEESERRKKEDAKNVVALPSPFKVPTGVAARRRGRSIGQATCMLMESAIRLRRWVLNFMRGGDETSIFPNFRFKISGWRPEQADDDYANTWMTSSIIRVIPPSLMITASSVYYLNGPMDVKQAREMGMPVSFCQAFSTGFPENWMQLLGDVYNTMIEPTGPRIEEVVSDTERASQKTRSNQEKHLSSSEAYSSEDEWADMRDRERKRKEAERRDREEQREREKQRKEEEKREREDQRARKSLEKAKEEKRKKEEAEKKKRRSSTSKTVLSVGPTELVPLRRSRSGRLLRPPMAEWAGQSAKYDAHGNLVEITGATTASHLLTPAQLARGNALAAHFGVSPSRISPLQQERSAQATTENAGKTPGQLKKRLSSVSNKSTAKRTPPVIAKKRATTSSTKRHGNGRIVDYSDSESNEESEEESNWERKKKKKTPQAARSPRTPLSLVQQRRKTPSTAEPTPVIGRVGGKRKMARIDSSDSEEEEERERREKREKREAAKWERRQIKEEEDESEEENRKKRRTQQRKRQVIAKRGASNRVRINSEMISECATTVHEVETEGEHEERENSRLTRPVKKPATTRERAKRETQRKKSRSEEKRKEEEAKSESTDLDELSARLRLSEGSDEEKEEERVKTEERRRVSTGTRKSAGGERAEEALKKPVKKRAQPWRVEELQRLKIAFNAVDMTRPDSWDKIAASLGGKRTIEEIKKTALERLNLRVDEQENEEEEDEDDAASIRSGEISDDNPAAVRKQTVLQRLRAEQAKEALLKGGSRRDEDFFENTVFDGPSMMPSVLAADLNDSMFSLLVTPEFAQPNKPRCTKRAQQAREAEAEADESPSPFTLFGNGTPLVIPESGRGSRRAARKSSFLPSPKKNDEDRIRFAHQLERRMNMSMMNRSRMTTRPDRTLDQTQRELDSVLKKSRALGKKRGRVLDELEEDDENEENEDVEEGGLLSMR